MLKQLRNVNFGTEYSDLTGSSGVGFRLFDVSGSVVGSRVTSPSVYQLVSGSGIYASYVDFPDSFRGQILWDTGTGALPTQFAVEEYNVEQNNPVVQETWGKLTSMAVDIEEIKDFESGRWHIVGNTMNFYKSDNTTLIASFDLYDDQGLPSSESIFQRRRV